MKRRLVDLGLFEACVGEAIGPGRRAGIWVRGCPFRCPGCCTPEFQQSGEAGHCVAVSDLIIRICDAVEKHDIEGVTFSGGEPFGQSMSLAVIAAACRELGLSVQCWTGYSIEELRGANAPVGAAELLNFIDVLIDGRYERDRPTAPMRGSDNQRLHFLTDRYGPDDYVDNPVELRLKPDGGLTSFGIIPPGTLEAMLILFGLESGSGKD